MLRIINAVLHSVLLQLAFIFLSTIRRGDGSAPLRGCRPQLRLPCAVPRHGPAPASVTVPTAGCLSRFQVPVTTDPARPAPRLPWSTCLAQGGRPSVGELRPRLCAFAALIPTACMLPLEPCRHGQSHPGCEKPFLYFSNS